MTVPEELKVWAAEEIHGQWLVIDEHGGAWTIMESIEWFPDDDPVRCVEQAWGCVAKSDVDISVFLDLMNNIVHNFELSAYVDASSVLSALFDALPYS